MKTGEKLRQIIVASNNKNKVREISKIMGDCNCEFLTLSEMGIKSDPEEDADTFLGNAQIKARTAYNLTNGKAVLADDSGLIVDALNGAPGVLSARYAGENATDEDNNSLLLKELEDITSKNRTARFVCTIVFIDENGKEFTAEGKVEGIIGKHAKGENGFGYDPLFYPDKYDHKISFAEVSDVEKNEISHRSQALNKIKSILF